MLGVSMRRALSPGFSAAHIARRSRMTAPMFSSYQPLRRLTNPRTTSTLSSTTVKRKISGKQSAAPPPSPPHTSPKPSQGKSIARRLLDGYTALLESRPLLTKAITSGIIAGAGDVTCQVLAARFMPEDASEEGSESTDESEKQVDGTGGDTALASVISGDIDWARCGRFSLVGAFFLAPSLHYWYGFLARILPNSTLRDVATRVVLDQVVFAPIFLGAFLSTIMLVDGKAAKIMQKLEADFKQTLMGNWAYWIPAQLINFRFVPPAFQVLCANGFGFVFNIYLSFQSNKAVEDDGDKEVDTDKPVEKHTPEIKISLVKTPQK